MAKITLIAYSQLAPNFSGKLRSEGVKVDSEPEYICALGKRLCQTKADLSDVMKRNTNELVKERTDSSIEDNHSGVFEHCLFTFVVEDVSRVLSHELVRHRIASYDQMSQRAVESGYLKAIVPKTVAEKEGAVLIYRAVDDYTKNAYRELMRSYNIPKEDARYALMEGTETRLMMSFNGRSLMHMLKLRTSKRALPEIQDFANEVLRQVREICPNMFGEELREYWDVGKPNKLVK